MKAPLSNVARAGIAACFAFSVVWLGCGPTSTPSPTITPAITSPTQPYACPNTVTMSDPNIAATIFYSDTGIPSPGAAGTKNYNQTGVFQVNGPGLVTVTAMAQAPSLSQSPFVTATFSCPPPPPPPTFTPMPTALETCPLSVLVNATAGTSIVVSNNGQPPSPTNNVYAGSPPSTQTVPAPGPETLQAIACSSGGLCSAPTSASYACAPPPPPDTFDTIDIALQTGNSPATQRLEVIAIFELPKTLFWNLCLKPSNDSSLQSGGAGVGQWSACANGASSAPTWLKGMGWDLTAAAGIGPIKLPTPLTQKQLLNSNMTMQFALLQSGCPAFSSSCNWDIQEVTVTFSDSTNKLTPTSLTMGSFITSGWNDDNCIAKLKAPPNATTVQFGLNNQSQLTPPIMYLTYVDGTSAEQGAVATCKDNGDGGTPP
jgi:hypothetical protein